MTDDSIMSWLSLSFWSDPTSCNYRGNQSYKNKKRAKIRNRYNQAPHLTQDTNEKVTTSQQDITNECREISPFQAGGQKASTNRRA